MLFLLYTKRECVCHFLRRVLEGQVLEGQVLEGQVLEGQVLEGQATNEAKLWLRCTLRTVHVMPVKQFTPLKILFTGENVIVIMIKTIIILALQVFN